MEDCGSCGFNAVSACNALLITRGGSGSCTILGEKRVENTYYVPLSIRAGIGESITGSTYENGTHKIIIVRSIDLGPIPSTVMALTIINLALLELAIYIGVRGYRELEITYYPEGVEFNRTE